MNGVSVYPVQNIRTPLPGKLKNKPGRRRFLAFLSIFYHLTQQQTYRSRIERRRLQ